MSFHIDNEYKATWTKIEDLKNIKLNALPVYADRYMKTRIRTYRDTVYANYRGLNVPEDDIKYDIFFTCIWKQILPVSIFKQSCL